jgi:hypothetical protein
VTEAAVAALLFQTPTSTTMRSPSVTAQGGVRLRVETPLPCSATDWMKVGVGEPPLAAGTAPDPERTARASSAPSRQRRTGAAVIAVRLSTAAARMSSPLKLLSRVCSEQRGRARETC